MPFAANNTMMSMVSPTGDIDHTLLQEIRRRNGMTVKELLESAGVTRTAVRQRLGRLMRLGMVQRRQVHQARGRPYHRYTLTRRADKLFGSNYSELAVTLWRQIKRLKDPKTRRELGRWVRDDLVNKYRDGVGGGSIDERLERLRQKLADRDIDVEIDRRGQKRILREHDCPYPSLAAADSSICALEKQVFAEVLGCGVKLTRCRLFGQGCCCEFEIRDRPSFTA